MMPRKESSEALPSSKSLMVTSQGSMPACTEKGDTKAGLVATLPGSCPLGTYRVDSCGHLAVSIGTLFSEDCHSDLHKQDAGMMLRNDGSAFLASPWCEGSRFSTGAPFFAHALLSSLSVLLRGGKPHTLFVAAIFSGLVQLGLYGSFQTGAVRVACSASSASTHSSAACRRSSWKAVASQVLRS
eukprot:1156607-Pelagomonas_calceolata.AAC.15